MEANRLEITKLSCFDLCRMDAVLEDREHIGKAWPPCEGIHSLLQECYTVSPRLPLHTHFNASPGLLGCVSPGPL